jgi:WD40 repeat protein
MAEKKSPSRSRPPATAASQPDGWPEMDLEPFQLVGRLTFTPDSRYLVILRAPNIKDPGSGIIQFWEPGGAEPVREIKLPRTSASVKTLAVSPDSRFIVAGHQTFRIYEVPTGKLAGYLEGHDTPNWEMTWDVAFSPDGKLVASASADKTSRLWEFESRKQIGCITHQDQVGAVVFAPDGQRVITGCRAFADPPPGSLRGLQSFDLQGANVVQYPHTWPDPPCWDQILVSPDERFLVAANGGPRWTHAFTVWDWKTGKFMGVVEVSEAQGGAFDMAFTPDSELLVTSHLEAVCIWSTKTWDCLSTIPAKGRMALSADGRFIAYETATRAVQIRPFVRPFVRP